ncbi:MAG TPA: response regulator [Aggregatilineales bacterium]|nr:response regulator [Aggregatilineales bacterium]
MSQKQEAPRHSLLQRKQTILVVEDNEDLRENAVLVLGLEGYNVFSAIDGQDALELLNSGKFQPDLIVSDIAMPRLDGYAFFNAVHAMPAWRAIPFIFLTARGSKHDIRFGKELGVDDYLVKPFNAEDFLVAIRNRLKRSQEMREQAEVELDDARRTLVKLISHELRTPLTYVTGGFSLLADGIEQEKLPQDLQLSMGLIRSGTQRLNHLAEQLILYAELISGHSRMQMDMLGEPVDLALLLKELVSVAEREYETRKVHFESAFAFDESVLVFAVADILRQGIYEVLRNAGSYSNADSVVHVGMTQDNGQVSISVADKGKGIAKVDHDKVWDILIQSERIKYEQQGAGMGLPIVKQVMLLHGGSVDLDSELGQGTTITLKMPIYTESANERGNESDNQNRSA